MATTPHSRIHAALNQNNIPGLDAMRAAAILLVILFHYRIGSVAPGIGVIAFFVLSGFLITGILTRELAKTGTLSLRTFYTRRAYRIFPAFYLCWFLTMGLALWKHEPVTWLHSAESFFYLSDYGRAVLALSAQYRYPMGISWSLAVEEQFYLLWPLLLLWIYKRPSPLRAITLIIFALWLWRALLIIGLHVSWAYAYNAFDTRADALMIGCWLSLALHRNPIPSTLTHWLSTKWLMLVPLLGLAVINLLETRGLLTPSLQVLEFTLDPVLLAILLLQWIYWGSQEWTLLEHPLIRFIARISYSLYLYHLVIKSLSPMFHRIVPLRHGQTFVLLAATVMVSAASYYGIERPFMRLRDRGRRPSVLLDDGLPAHEALTPVL